jgi:hypothetical protein
VTQRLQLLLEPTDLRGERVHGVEEFLPLAHRGLV